MVLDGLQVRRGLSEGPGISFEERPEDLQHSAHLARILNKAGIICIAAFVAPNAAVLDTVAGLIGTDKFLLVHVEALTDRRRSARCLGSRCSVRCSPSRLI